MGFVNEYIKENQRVFVDKNGKKYSSDIWTIDKEKDEILFLVRQDKEPPHYYVFKFFIQKHLISLTASRGSSVIKNAKWKLESISIPKELDTKEVLNELEKAFITYGWTGWNMFNYDEWIYEFEIVSSDV